MRIKNSFLDLLKTENINNIDDLRVFFVNTLLKYLAFITYIAFIPGIFAIIENKNYEVIGYFAVVAFFISFLAFNKSIAFKFKSVLLIITFYLLGIGLLITLGSIFLGPHYLFSATILIAVLYSLKYSLLSTIVNTFLIYLFSVQFKLYSEIWGRSIPLTDTELISLLISYFSLLIGFSIIVSRGIELLGINLNELNESSKQIEQEKNNALKLNKSLNDEIKEREIIQKELYESKDRLSQALEASTDGYWEWNVETGETYFSPRYYTMLGYDAYEFLPSYDNFESLIKPEFIELLKSSVYKTIDTGMGFHIDFQLRTKSGDWKWISTRAFAAVKDANGKAIKLVGVHSDISKRKEIELQLQKLNDNLKSEVSQRTQQLEDTMYFLKEENTQRKLVQNELQQAKDNLIVALEKERELNDLKSRFIQMITHEYRTPLTSILTSSYVLEILYEKQDNDEFKKYLSRIQSSVDSMRQLMEDVLMLGEYQFNNVNVEISKTNLIELLRKSIEEQTTILGKARKIIVNTEKETVFVDSNSRLLQYIINNLISNAIKYSRDHEEITISFEERDECVCLIVRDEGIGIPEDDLNRIFEPFHRGSNIGAVEGAGIGLALVKQYIDILGIEIKFDTKVNEGTQVTLTFVNEKL